MNIILDKVKKLRKETLAGILECKKALEESDGNLEEAKKVLRKRGVQIAQRKSGKATNQGIIASYIHHNKKIGVMVEIHCESDFVSKNNELQRFAKDLTMHIAASNPEWIISEDIPTEVIEEKKSILEAQAKKEGKPQRIMEKIVQGRIKKFYNQTCLLNQPFVKDEKSTVKDYLHDIVIKLGENIKIHRFVRYELGKN